MQPNEALLIKFENYLKLKGYAERTIPGYVHNVKVFLDYLQSIGIENIGEVDRRVITDYQQYLYVQTYKGKPLSMATQHLRLSYLKVFYRYLLSNNYVAFDPTTIIELPKTIDRIPRNILSKKQMGELLSQPDLETPLGIRDRAIVELLYCTGIRSTELINLKLNDLNLREGELRIIKGKGGKDRIVPLGEIASDYIELYLREARPKLTNSEQDLLFVTKNGQKLYRTYLSVMFRKYTGKANLPKGVTPHGIRATCATHLLKGKADIRQIQQLLGHASVATTQIYTRVDISDLKQVHKRSHPRERREIDVKEY